MDISLTLKKITTNSNYNTRNKNIEYTSIQRAVKTTIQILYDEGLFDNYAKADKVLEDFLFAKRRRADLEEVSDNIQ